VTGALEVQRTAKVIGSSLEAAPVVHVSPEMMALLETVSFEDVCITSCVWLSTKPAPDGAFTLADVPGVAVVFELAAGEKCERCWKVLRDVGTHKHPCTCQRCNDALG
jgi:isoleucyl-tRNA synthetase